MYFFPICFVFAKSDSLEQEREKVIKEHSVLEQIWIKGSYLEQRLSEPESLYFIGLKSATI